MDPKDRIEMRLMHKYDCLHAKLQPQPHFLEENMQVESTAREFCIFPSSRAFSVVGSLVKFSQKIMWEVWRENADWIVVHAISATATAATNFAVRPAYWSSLQEGGIQTAFFLRLRDRVHGIQPTKYGCGRKKVQSV